MQQTIQPVDSFIKDGFLQKVIQQFRAQALYVTSPDKLKALQTLLNNATPKYPYLFLNVQSQAPNPNSYTSHLLSRQGIPVSLNTDNNQFQLARIIPTLFEVEMTFITNAYSGGLESVEGFNRRWLLVRRNGAMQFNVDYGLSQLSISYQLGDSISIPARENPAEAESVYQVVTQATINGYVSEPVLGTRGRINNLQFGIKTSDQLAALNSPNSQVMLF